MANEAVGYICVIIAIAFFGSNWVVAKKVPSGDGVFFQWAMCIGILIVGIFTQMIAGASNQTLIYLEPFALLGGAIWCTGNMLCVPVIQMIGLSLGPGIWGIGNMVMGWLTGTFGFFGLASDRNNVKIFWLNCVGAVLTALSVPFYAFIKTSTKEERAAAEEAKKKEEGGEGEKSENTPKAVEMSDKSEKSNENAENKTDLTKAPETEVKEDGPKEEEKQEFKEVEEESPIFIMIKAWPKWVQMIVGVILAVVAGVLFGSAFDPSKYLQDNGKASPEGIDYVLAHFLGIFLASNMYFICYIILFQNKPFIYKQTILPAMMSGM
ncbi:hypothetical protein EIN_167710, partial [Entamoeba invadens IP1]